jgi:anti-sigma factor RsiW
MKHPSERRLIRGFLQPGGDREAEAHLAGCEECAEKVRSLERLLAAVQEHSVPECASAESGDLFAAAWTGSRRTGRREPGAVWRRLLQPAGVFAAGLLAGFLFFGNLAPLLDSGLAQRSEETHAADAPRNAGAQPTDSPNVASTQPTPAAGRLTEEAVQTPPPEGEDFWRMAGLKNVKLTPTVRYEKGQPVYGAVLEGETLGGALVVLTF